jgi:hypothetical protein
MRSRKVFLNRIERSLPWAPCLRAATTAGPASPLTQDRSVRQNDHLSKQQRGPTVLLGKRVGKTRRAVRPTGQAGGVSRGSVVGPAAWQGKELLRGIYAAAGMAAARAALNRFYRRADGVGSLSCPGWPAPCGPGEAEILAWHEVPCI